MARIITLSIIAILIQFIYTPDALAQKFVARDGLPAALNKVQDDVVDNEGNVIKAGMANPELFAVGTLSGQLPNLPIALEYDLKTGEATVWIYFFKSADNSSDFRAIGVGKIFITYIAQEISLADIGELPIELDDIIDLDKWAIDSDDLADKLWENDDFKNYLAAYPDTKLEMLGLGVSFENIFFDTGTATWAGVFSDGDSPSLNCFTSAETGETLCFSLSSLPDEILGQIELYPNPANGQLRITLPEEILNREFSLSISDALGNIMTNGLNPSVLASGRTIMISVNDYVPGAYFVRFTGRGFSFVRQFVVRR